MPLRCIGGNFLSPEIVSGFSWPAISARFIYDCECGILALGTVLGRSGKDNLFAGIPPKVYDFGIAKGLGGKGGDCCCCNFVNVLAVELAPEMLGSLSSSGFSCLRI